MFNLHAHVCLSSTVLLISLFITQPVAAISPTVTIPPGIVIGTTTTLPSVTAVVNKYLGIPFAASPPRRFLPPAPPASWSKPLMANSFKDTCLQQFNYPEASRNFSLYLNQVPPPAPVESEDCLYLNVFVPATATSASGLAVMFWIYGGNLQSGTATYPFYDGSSFAANQNVIMVTHNYRTNVFGFPNSPELPLDSENLGFLDQRMALQWVQQNIRYFGGDPSKVTIFGESAGGYSVKQLLTSPPHPLPFHAAILESETVLLFANGTVSWESLVAAVNCTSAASHIDCVRSVSATTIQTAIEVAALTFPPVVDNKTESGNVSSAFTFHTAAHVPILIGTNSQEGRLFAYAEGLEGPLGITTFLNATFPGQSSLQASVAAAYPLTVYQTAYFAISAIITDLFFTCPISELANLADDSGYAVWRYYFNASFPDLQLFPNAGAFHTSEIPLVFGTYETLLPDVSPTPQEEALSKYMQTAWARFAKNPLKGPGWPRLRANGGRDLGDLGSNGADGEVTIRQAMVDYHCPLYRSIIVGEGL
ncbi:hypothetical protein MMC18_005478 [Xylographa bjoerkii]|nr:hypothetical protein [Xylographa bjoerkii]